jgi:hypothetical protein
MSNNNDNSDNSNTSNTSKTKLADNTLVNDLTKENIDNAVNTWFTSYKTNRLKSTAKQVKTARLAYIVEVDGVLWLNPLAFSITKMGTGYCTAPFKVEELKTLVSGRSQSKKTGNWAPRIPVHCVLWRYYNDYEQISNQISHINGNKLIANEDNLQDEDGVINRSRTACHKYEWMLYEHIGHVGCLRCPHEPICKVLVTGKPPDDVFLHSKPAGSKYLNKDD